MRYFMSFRIGYYLSEQNLNIRRKSMTNEEKCQRLKEIKKIGTQTEDDLIRKDAAYLSIHVEYGKMDDLEEIDNAISGLKMRFQIEQQSSGVSNN